MESLTDYNLLSMIRMSVAWETNKLFSPPPSTILCYHYKKNPWLKSTSELYWPSDRRVLAKLVPTLGHRWCRVVSAMDPHGRNFGFLDLEQLLFHSSSSSVILTRLSGPCSRPTTSQATTILTIIKNYNHKIASAVCDGTWKYFLCYCI
jgi:hypothetical protein